MERAGTTLIGGMRPDDLVALAERSGPFATVCVGRAAMGGWSAHADETRAADLVGALAALDAPAGAIDAAGAALASLPPEARGAVVVTDDEQPLLVEALDDEPRREFARWSAQPSLAPVIEHRQGQIPVIVVLADRRGADVAVRGAGPDRSATVEGGDSPITKSAPGGWSQARYQRRAEDSWEHNAAVVAEHVQRLATDSIELIVLGGDLRAVDLIRDRLGMLAPITHVITAGRAADGSEEQREVDIRRLVHTAVAEHTVELLRAFAQEDGRHARAANGAADTLAALRRSQVDVLLAHDDADDDRRAWLADEPGAVALDQADLEAVQSTGFRSARLVDVAIHGALRTGAAIRIVASAARIDGGIAAILRWAEA